MAQEEPLLAACAAASVRHRIATGARAGMPVMRLGDRIETEDVESRVGEQCASVQGFSLHAGVVDLAGLAESAAAELRVGRMATSLDNMSPDNIFIQTLAEVPIAPGVAQNSIVAVRGDGPAEGGNDGVVRFSSAHTPDAESELIVRSGHSTQSNPHTVNEVDRILMLHADRSTCAAKR